MQLNQAKQDYVSLLHRVHNSIEGLINEIEDGSIHNQELRQVSIDMAMDSVPAARFLKEAKKQIEISLSVYED